MTHHAKFHVNLPEENFAEYRWNIRKKFIPMYFFTSTYLQVRLLSEFLRAMAQTMRYQARVCLFGLEN